MEKVRIQDDLYTYVNQEWLDQAIIPDDLPMTGGFASLEESVRDTLIRDLNEMCEKGNYSNKYMENACRLYSKYKDTKRRNREKMRPVQKYLNKIEKLKDCSSLNRNLKELVLNSYPLPFKVEVMEDMSDTSKRCVAVFPPRTILPDSSYYKPENAQQKEMMIGLWTNMAHMILSESKLSPENQELYISDALKFDAAIGSLVKTSEELSEYTKMYNPMSTRTVSGMLKPIKFRQLCSSLFDSVPELIIVTDPRYFKSFKTVFNAETFEQFKHWAYVRKLIDSTSFLSEHLNELGSMFMMALTGVQKVPSAEKRAYEYVSATFANPIGNYYGEKYFGEKAKEDATEIVKEIIEQYKERIQKNNILTEQTKKQAIVKLSKMAIKIGYANYIDPVYDKGVIDESDSLLDTAIMIERIEKEYEYSKLHKPVDRGEWIMHGHVVNAGYNPMFNDISFPAAILQPPFYSINQTRSENLGGIGAVIGHEISHAFDNNGAKFDETGSLNNWWTKEDLKKFNASTKAMIKEFEGIELPWGKVNSKLIVSENIADNGGMAVTIDIMNKSKGASFEEYFKNWARVWCLKAKPEYLQLLLTIDVHAPAILRANMPPRNFEEWYNTFNVTKKDKMYIAPNKRVVIW